MIRKPRLLILGLVALAAVALAALPALATSGTSQVTGAIFTTTSDGSTVNGNIYDSKEAVYLNGGPGHRSLRGHPAIHGRNLPPHGDGEQWAHYSR